MDPNPIDIKLDMIRSKTSYWYNKMYVKINIALGLYDEWFWRKAYWYYIILVYIVCIHPLN